MDQGNLAILVDAKFEYTKQLINILKNNLFQGIKKIYNNAKEYSIEHDESDRILKKFQFYLSEIPKWNQEMILSQVSDILEKSKCDWLEELITAVFVSHTRILTSINSGKAKKKINLNIPKIDHFIHQCYIDAARAFWKTPYLFDDTLSNYDYQRNRRDAEGLIETSIQETIRKQLPVKHILKEYLGKDYETDDEEENIESEDYSNLRKMVKAEIENCSKEQLLGSSETPAVATETENATATETKPDVAPAQSAEPVTEEPTTEETAKEEPVTAESVSAEPEKTPEVKEGGESENVSLKVEELTENNENNENNGMKIETLDLDNVESLEDLTKLDLNTQRILSKLADPNGPPMVRKGMVVGNVQSGKTANYIGLISKAADAGYKVIVVLAGMLDDLRIQTQIRLEEGFIGKNVSNQELVGVGKDRKSVV